MLKKITLSSFEEIFFEKDMQPAGANNTQRSLSPGACRAALFIMLYRGYPLLQLPFQLLKHLLEIDEQLSSWRYRHMNMVHRMIGTRIGTGGSSGKDYLKAAADRHYIFKEIAQLNSFLIERRKLPLFAGRIRKTIGFCCSLKKSSHARYRSIGSRKKSVNFFIKIIFVYNGRTMT